MPFRNSTFGGQSLIRDLVKSPNFQTGIDGWMLARNGDAELNDVTIRGSLDVNGNVVLDGSDLLVVEDDGGGPALTFSESAGTWNGYPYPAGLAVQYRPDPLTDPTMFTQMRSFAGISGTAAQTGFEMDRIDATNPTNAPGQILFGVFSGSSDQPVIFMRTPNVADGGAIADNVAYIRMHGRANNNLGDPRIQLGATETEFGERLWSGTSHPFENPSVEGVAVIQDHYQANRNGGILLHLNRNTSNGEMIRFRRSDVDVGSIDVTTTATAYNTSSDYRLKHDVADLTGCLARILACAPRTFKWNVDGSPGEGFIAHELAMHVPAAVSGQKNAVYDGSGEDPAGTPNYQSVDLGRLTPHLVGAVHELYTRLTALEAAVLPAP